MRSSWRGVTNLFVRSTGLISARRHQQNPLPVSPHRFPCTGDPWEQRSAPFGSGLRLPCPSSGMKKVRRCRPECVMVRNLVLGRRAGLNAEVAGMQSWLLRTIEVLLTVAILAVALHLLLILYFAGYSLSLSFMTIQAQNVAPPTILLMVLILSRVAMRCCVSSGKNLCLPAHYLLLCLHDPLPGQRGHQVDR